MLRFSDFLPGFGTIKYSSIHHKKFTGFTEREDLGFYSYFIKEVFQIQTLFKYRYLSKATMSSTILFNDRLSDIPFKVTITVPRKPNTIRSFATDLS